MMHRFITVMTLCVYCFWISGCATTTIQTLIRDELPEWANEKIVEVMLDNGDIILFDNAGGRYVEYASGQTVRPMIVGNTWDKIPAEIAVEKVLYTKIEKSEVDVGETVLLVLLGLPVIALAIVFIILILFPPHF